MKFLSFFVAIAVLAACPLAHAQDSKNSVDSQTQQKCEIGPAHRTYGNAPWLVFSCEDGKSIVIVTAQGNPAMPFYFTFYPDNGHYRLHGEGTGGKQASAEAFEEIKKLTKADIDALVAETKTK